MIHVLYLTRNGMYPVEEAPSIYMSNFKPLLLQTVWTLWSGLYLQTSNYCGEFFQRKCK